MNPEQRIQVEEELIHSLPPDVLKAEGIEPDKTETEKRQLMQSHYDGFIANLPRGVFLD